MPSAPCITDEYTKERWNLFEKYTLPSVINQTHQPDIWVIYFDEERSIPIRAKIEEMASTHRFIQPCFVESHAEVIPDLRLRCSTAGGICITSRLDNDDILHPAFIEDVQAAAKLQATERCVIDFPIHYNLELKEGRIFRVEKSHVTSFASLAERHVPNSREPMTVLVAQHPKLRQTIGLVRYVHTPRTMAILHGTNVLNRKRKKRLVDFLLRRTNHSHLSNDEARLVRREFCLP